MSISNEENIAPLQNEVQADAEYAVETASSEQQLTFDMNTKNVLGRESMVISEMNPVQPNLNKRFADYKSLNGLEPRIADNIFDSHE